MFYGFLPYVELLWNLAHGKTICMWGTTRIKRTVLNSTLLTLITTPHITTHINLLPPVCVLLPLTLQISIQSSYSSYLHLFTIPSPIVWIFKTKMWLVSPLMNLCCKSLTYTELILAHCNVDGFIVHFLMDVVWLKKQI